VPPALAYREQEHRRLERKECRGEKNKRSCAPQGQHHHDAIALDKEELVVVPAEFVAVQDDRIGHVHDLPPALAQPNREVAILVVRKELSAQAAEVVPQ